MGTLTDLTVALSIGRKAWGGLGLERARYAAATLEETLVRSTICGGRAKRTRRDGELEPGREGETEWWCLG
ncbi:hypothetical protein E2C01_084731 [Portunus trituberculatus]|uniref:Uncharacterized protein n=1 Tax=Portunus trituberculatus TaxID=210409 RepID=A0A5B7IW36_PORTR|nr:hypothetical protein [Portunus trituberculatus]